MRVPFTIPQNTLKVYTPSEFTVNMKSEVKRTILAENLEFGEDKGPLLSDLCVQKIVEDFEQTPERMKFLNLKDKIYLLELLPTKLPKTLTIPLINEDTYWKRCVKDKWDKVPVCKYFDGNWKKYYMEREMKEYIEEQMLEYYDLEAIETKIALTAQFIIDLNIDNLMPCEPAKPPIEDPDKPLDKLTDHFPIGLILRKLPNLETVRIRYGPKNLGQKFEWHLLDVSVADCTNLAECLLNLQHLRLLCIHMSALGDAQLQALIKGIIQIPSIEELDFTYCKIGDQGGLILGKLISEHPNLKKLKLAGNKIGELGAKGIGYGLKQPNSCPIELLDLRLNPLGDEGAINLFCGLVRVKKPKYLGLSSIGVESAGGCRIGEAMKLQPSIQELDICANKFGEEAGNWLVSSMEQNIAVLALDYRETDITDEQMEKLDEYVLRNRESNIPLRLSLMHIQSEEIIERVFSFPVTDSEILLQDYRDEMFAAGIQRDQIIIIKEPPEIPPNYDVSATPSDVTTVN